MPAAEGLWLIIARRGGMRRSLSTKSRREGRLEAIIPKASGIIWINPCWRERKTEFHVENFPGRLQFNFKSWFPRKNIDGKIVFEKLEGVSDLFNLYKLLKELLRRSPEKDKSGTLLIDSNSPLFCYPANKKELKEISPCSVSLRPYGKNKLGGVPSIFPGKLFWDFTRALWYGRD